MRLLKPLGQKIRMYASQKNWTIEDHDWCISWVKEGQIVCNLPTCQKRQTLLQLAVLTKTILQSFRFQIKVKHLLKKEQLRYPLKPTDLSSFEWCPLEQRKESQSRQQKEA